MNLPFLGQVGSYYTKSIVSCAGVFSTKGGPKVGDTVLPFRCAL